MADAADDLDLIRQHVAALCVGYGDEYWSTCDREQIGRAHV